MNSDPGSSTQSKNPISIQCNASETEIKVERVIQNWTVKNFSHCYQEYLENFVNLAKGDETLTWSVKIYPKGNGDNNKDFVFLCLNRVLGPNVGKFSKVGFKSRFIMKNMDGKEIEMRVHPNPSHSDYVSYIKRDVLFPQIQPQDAVLVIVEIDVAVETVTTNGEDSFVVPDPTKQLMHDYERLLKSQQFADFVIEVGDRKLRVHKCILAARSIVFAAMLNHDTEEAQKGVLEIKDLDYDVVQEMLNYLYCGRCNRLNELGADLLVAADKYSLPDLKARCEKALIKALTIENACELLILSDAHSATQLKERTVEYVVRNSFEVTRTSGWQLLLKQRPELVTEVVQSFSKPQDVYCLN